MRRPVLAAATAGTLAIVIRRLGRRSGATTDEVRTSLPGDDLVHDPLWISTRAITIAEPVSAIWPWIVQMGFPAYRAGWYTPYWLDRLQWGIRAQSADRIRPDLQHLDVGDLVPDSIDGSAFFTVAEVEHERALVLHSTRHLLKPMHAIDFSWAFVLEPVTANETRLLMRARARCEPRHAWTLLGSVIGLGDFLNASVMLRGIKRRSEFGDPPRPARAEDGDGDGMPAAAPSQILRGLTEVAVAAPLFLSAPLYHGRHLRWGATDVELSNAMPGDELVPDSSFATTRAITIDAPPELVWPWIVQMGFGRAGFYSYDLFDNAGRPSADRIVPEYQSQSVGDWVPMASKVTQTTAFRISDFEPNRWMLWEKPHSTWAWRLTPVEGNRTRLVTRLKDRYDWRRSPGNAVLSLILFELGDFPMMRKLLLGVRARAERLADEEAAPPVHRRDY